LTKKITKFHHRDYRSSKSFKLIIFDHQKNFKLNNLHDFRHGPASPAARQLAAELDEIRRVSNDSQMRLPQNNLFASTSLPRTLHSKVSDFNKIQKPLELCPNVPVSCFGDHQS
jgi:hypothetical protein